MDTFYVWRAPRVAQGHCCAQAHELQGKDRIGEIRGFQLAHLPPVAQHQEPQMVQFGQGKAGCIRMVQDVGAVMVVVAV